MRPAIVIARKITMTISLTTHEFVFIHARIFGKMT